MVRRATVGSVKLRSVAEDRMKMNRTEEGYSAHLLLRRQAGEVAWYGFEAMTLRLADQTRFTVDFAVLVPAGDGAFRLEGHEVKGGFFREAARVRVRVAASEYPWISFVVVRLVRGRWTFEPVPPGELQPDPAIRAAKMKANRGSSEEA
jgi:hypothetical protein